jgi:hypothetical protein
MPPGPGGVPLSLLPCQVLTQRGDRGRIQRDDKPSGVALRRCGYDPPAKLLQLRRHRQGPCVQVQVRPGQPGSLPEPQPAQRHHMEQRVQPMLANMGEEALVCPAVHTPELGRQPFRSRRSVRAGVHTCGRDHNALGSSGNRPGLDAISPDRTAPFNATRSVA